MHEDESMFAANHTKAWPERVWFNSTLDSILTV